jgi:glycosyltransferase involved in cell wall biosynthesis
MNILMLGRWLPPPRQPVRTMREYHFARQLARGHRLTLAFVADTSDVSGSVSALRSEFGDLEFATVPRAWKSLASAVRLAAGESCTLSYFRSEALRTRLADRMRHTHYDLVFVLSSGMIQYALEVDPAIPMAVDFGSVDSAWWAQQAERGTFGAARFFRTEAVRLRTAEAVAARRAARCVVDSLAAASIIKNLSPAAVVSVIPSGVELDDRAGGLPVGKVPTVVLTVGANDDAEVEGAMKFCEAIGPGVRAKVPDVRFVIAGGRSGASGLARKAPSGIELASVGMERRQVFHDCTVAVAPLLSGSDIRKGVLELMAVGVPVVTSSRVRGELGVQVNVEVKVADTPPDVGTAIVELLQDSALRRMIGDAGRRFVQRNFSWKVSGARLEETLTGLAGAREIQDGENGPGPTRALLGG